MAGNEAFYGSLFRRLLTNLDTVWRDAGQCFDVTFRGRCGMARNLMSKCLGVLILALLLPAAMAQENRMVDAWGKRYFPEGREGFHVPYLLAMKEPSVMAKLPRNVERVARFTLLRSFHAPLAVRITWQKDGVILARAVRLQRSYDFNKPGPIEHTETVRLRAASVAFHPRHHSTRAPSSRPVCPHLPHAWKRLQINLSLPL